MPNPGHVLIRHRPTQPGLGAIVPSVNPEYPHRGPSVGHLGPSVGCACDLVDVLYDTGTHLESAEFPMPASGLVVPVGFDSDQCGKEFSFHWEALRVREPVAPLVG